MRITIQIDIAEGEESKSFEFSNGPPIEVALTGVPSNAGRAPETATGPASAEIGQAAGRAAAIDDDDQKDGEP